MQQLHAVTQALERALAEAELISAIVLSAAETFGISIGDVVGRLLRAAILTGQLRVAALAGPDPCAGDRRPGAPRKTAARPFSPLPFCD